MSNTPWKEIGRAAFVIARRDFTALVRSKAFIFFLLTPLIMLAIAIAAGGIGARMIDVPPVPVIAITMPDADAAKLLAARERLSEAVADLPLLEQVRSTSAPGELFRDGRDGKHYAAILSGSLEKPRLDSSANGTRIWPNKVRLMIERARTTGDFRAIPISIRTVAMPAVPTVQEDRSTTAQLGQMALFLTTMLLAGMVLSNMVEEKTNKIIEILAASIPMEAIFLGKLFAMLAMALIAIAAWTTFGAVIGLSVGSALPAIPAPAVGWPLFVLLGVLYFSTAYLLLGSLYLGIGAMAATVREVQTLSMPVSMGQLGIFLFSSYAMAHPDSAVEIAACIFPFSSPFALLARAAESPEIWPHLLALLWQALCTWAIIRLGTALFRHNVMKSGSGWRRRKAECA